jgi:hypothetical protein
MSAILASLTAVFALLGAALIIARPYWAFVAVAAMFPIEQLLQAYFPFLQVHTTYVNVAIGGLALFAFLVRVSKREDVFSGLNNPVTLLVCAQFALWMIGTLYSGQVAPDETHIRTTGPYLLLRLALLPLLIIGIDEFRRMTTGLMLVGSVLAILIILNPNTSYWAGRLTIDLSMMSRSADQVGNPLATATLGGTMALIAALIVPQRKSPFIFVLRISAFVLGMGLAIGSGSRGQVLATVVACIMFFPLARRLNNPRNFVLTMLGGLVVAVGVYATFQFFIGDQNRERWDPVMMVRDIAMRFDMCWWYLAAWISSPGHWLFGLGTNAWMGIGADRFNSDYVHNIAVEILCEQGLVGATIFIAMTVLVIRSGLRLWRLAADDPSYRSVAAILLAICAFDLFNELKQGNISSGIPFFWWMVLAKIAFHELRQSERASVSASDVPPVEAGTGYGEVAIART